MKVSWEQKDQSSYCSFPYGLPRKDVQMAIAEGP